MFVFLSFTAPPVVQLREGDHTFCLRFLHAQTLITRYLTVSVRFVAVMDALPRFGVSKELSHVEFTRRLHCAKDLEIAKLSPSLFEDTKANGLAHSYSQLVTRKKVGGGKSAVEKHVEDIWLLVCSKNRVPHVVLRNGKRSKEEFEQSQSNSCQANSAISSKLTIC